MINLVLLILIVICLVFISCIAPPDSPWAPWWQIPDERIRVMCTLGKIDKQSLIYDLGSGTGCALCIAAKEFHAKGVGIEIDPLRVWISKWNVKRFGVSDNVTILQKNFFHVDLSPATVLFIYLIPPALIRLANKFVHELKPGTILISYKYEIPVSFFSGRLTLIKEDQKNELYVYKVKK